MKVDIEHVSFSYEKDGEKILDDISFEALPGQLTTIVGANGAGKTTLLKCIAGLHRHEGEIKFDGQTAKHEDMVQKLSFMEQNTDCSVNLNVFQIVLLGMVQQLGFKVSPDDVSNVNEVLDLVGVKQYANRRIGELSGGQRQLAFMAQALVKHPDVLLLDEPTGALDLYHQIKLMKFVKEVTKKRNCVTLMTLHHLDMALKYSDKVVVINNRHLYKEGLPNEVFTEKMLLDVYHVNGQILTDSEGDKYMHILDAVDDIPRNEVNPASADDQTAADNA